MSRKRVPRLVDNHSGGYVIYYEAPGAATHYLPAFDVKVSPVSASAAVRSVESYGADVTYTFGSHEGRAVLTLQISRPGTFLVEAPGAPAVAGGSVLAIGHSIAGGIVGSAVVSAVLIPAGIGGIGVIAITRHIRAKRARPAAPLRSLV